MPDLWDAAKEVCRGKYIPRNSILKKIDLRSVI